MAADEHGDAAPEHAAKAERPAGAGEGPKPKKLDSSVLVGIVGFLIALSVGFFVGQLFKDSAPEPGVELETGPRYAVRLRGDEPSRGADAPLVTIIEFADYECPYCAQANEPLKLAAARHPEDVRILYKHFPLPGHAKAVPAAKAAWAAAQQGQFWAMHDFLFENGGSITRAVGHAETLEIDMPKFLEDTTSDAAAKAVDEDLFAGSVLGLTGTPAFFVNGHKYVGLKSEPQWEEIIVAELEQAKQLVEGGVARADVYAKLMEGALTQGRARPARRAPGGPDPAVSYRVTADGRPSLGPDDALVTIVEFSDFQCPYCSKLGPVSHALVDRADDVRVVFRNLPLPKHARARDAARVGLAAHRQGKFWEMHDLLFDNQARMADLDFEELAQQLALDIAQFRQDMADPELEALIAQDEKLAAHFKVNSTPSMFINGRLMRGAQSVSAYQVLIEEERAKAQALVDGGTPRAEVYDAVMQQASRNVEL